MVFIETTHENETGLDKKKNFGNTVLDTDTGILDNINEISLK